MAALPTKNQTAKGGIIILLVFAINYLVYPAVPKAFSLSIISSLLFLLPYATVVIMLRPRTLTCETDGREVVNSAWICSACGFLNTVIVVGLEHWPIIALQGFMLGYTTAFCARAKRKIKARHAGYRSARK